MRTLLVSLALLFPTLAVIPSPAQNGGLLYDNGLPCPGYCHDAWPINDGYVVSDSFFVGTNSRVSGFDFYTWEIPGDRVMRVQWSITSSEFGGTTYGGGTVLVASDVVLGLNEYGYDVDRVSVTGLNVVVPAGTSWLNLQNVIDEDRYPVWWDENSGIDCHSLGCPSLASENEVGTIPSESFDIEGTHLAGAEDRSSEPERSSMLWSSVLAGLAAALRRIVL